MANLSEETIGRFVAMGENNLSLEKPFLVDRISLAVISGTNTYEIPDYIKSIRRITYKGRKLSPLSFRQERENFYGSPLFGTPFWYIYNDMGSKSIKLWPTPQESFPSVSGVWDVDIANGLVIEFYRTPGTRIANDNTSLWGSGLWGGTFWGGQISREDFYAPDFVRRQLLKQFVAYKSNQIEGAQQNQKLLNYYSSRWEIRKAAFYDLIRTLHNSPRKLIVSGESGTKHFPGTPLLPISRFGQSVETGL